MANRDPKQVEQAFRRERWLAFVSDLRRAWAMWVFVCATLSAVTYYVATPIQVVETVRGVAVGAHLPPSEDNTKLMRLSVRLESGATVTIQTPRGTLYREGAVVDLEILRREWPPHVLTHQFVGYAEPVSP